MDVSTGRVQHIAGAAIVTGWARPLRIAAHFLSDAEDHSKQEAGEEMNFMYQGIQLTRYFRALKFWMSLKVFGLGCNAAGD